MPLLHGLRPFLKRFSRKPTTKPPEDTAESLNPHTLQVREAMTPRADIIALPKSASGEEVQALLVQKNFEALPIFEESLDYIVGIVRTTTLLQYPKLPWQNHIENAVFTAPSMSFKDSFRILSEHAQPFLMVVDEYGGVDGLLTKSDLLNFLLEKLSPETGAFVTEQKSFSLLEGRLPLERFNTLFPEHALKVPENLEDDVTTLSGFVCYLQNAVPPKGTVIEHDGLSFKILDSDARKINRLMVLVTPSVLSSHNKMEAP